MKKVKFPLTDEDVQTIIEYFDNDENGFDITFLDRALVMQFKAFPENLKIVKASDYIKFLTDGFLASLYNYCYELQKNDDQDSSSGAE